MATNALNGVMHHLRRATRARDEASLTDSDLLAVYLAQRDESAFAELMRRHGPMVLATCLRILRHQADAEDAFQATFLVLARKAASIRPGGMVSNWLYGVAHNTALKADAMRRKRRAKEQQATPAPRCSATTQDWQDTYALVDSELSALADKYRVPIVLCELEGKTIKEAARQLGWPEGTVATRLRRGRLLLKARLTKRGITFSGTVLGGMLARGAEASVPATLASATTHAAALYALGPAAPGTVSATVATLADGVVKSMLLGKMKLVTALLLLGLVACAVPLLAGLTHPAHSAAPPAARATLDTGVLDDEEPDPVEFAANPIVLAGGSNVAIGVAISPDGKRIAAGMGSWNRPGRVQVWDFASRKPLWSQDEARGVYSVAFSPDSSRLAWSGWIGGVRVDEVTPRRQRIRLPQIEHNFYVAYSRDRKWLAVAGENRTLRLLEAATGRLAATLEGDSLAYFCVGFSRDSKLLAAGGGRWGSGGSGGGPNQVNLFDVATRKQVGKLTGHTSVVIQVAFAPRDALIATASADSTVRLWDGKSFTLLKTLTGHAGPVKGLAFSPDGSLLATGSSNRTIRLWDPVAGTEVAQLEGHPGSVQEIAFSPDGQYLVSSGDHRSVKLWNVKERTLAATLHEDPEPDKAVIPLTMAVSPDGKFLVTGNENGEIHFLDAVSGVVRRTLAGHEDAVTALVFSRDGKFLASAGPDLVIKVWDAHSGKLRHTLKGHKSWVYVLAFAPDGKTLASGAYDKTVRLWDTSKGLPLGTLTGHKASVRALAFSPDSKLLASGGSDRQVRLWDLASKTGKAVLKEHDEAIRAVGFSSDGAVLVSAGENGQLCLWDPAREKLLGKPHTAAGEVACVAFSPMGRLFVTGSEGNGFALRDTTTGEVRKRWSGTTRGIRTLAFGRGGQDLFSLSEDGTLGVWRGVAGPLRTFAGHTGAVRVALFSPDGKHLLSCGGPTSGDRTLRLWDVKSGKQVRLFMTAETDLGSAAFSSDGKHVAASEATGAIHLFEVASGKEVRTLTDHEGEVPDVAFSRDGKWLLSAGSDRTMRLFDARTLKSVRVFNGEARCVLFHSDGKRILCGARNGKVRVWDLASGTLLKTIDHDGDWVEHLALLPDGKRFLTCGADRGPMRLFDLESGKLIRSFTGHSQGTTWLALAKGGRMAFSSSYDGSTRLWDVETGQELKRFHGHRDWIRCVDVSPDGKTFATAGGGNWQDGRQTPGSDFAIRLWKMPAVTPTP